MATALQCSNHSHRIVVHARRRRRPVAPVPGTELTGHLRKARLTGKMLAGVLAMFTIIRTYGEATA